MNKITLRTIRAALSTLAASALVLMPFAGVASVASAATPQATTTPATSITSSDATLNGMNGNSAADNSSFWVATSTFATPPDGSPFPAGVYSTPLLGAQAANAAFSASLSSATGLPPVTSDTTYYFAAWTEVGGTWSSGAVESFTTVSAPTITNINPSSGSTAGGTPITITGTDFNSGATVTVGGVAATSVIVASSTSITATTPAGTAGAQDVVVTNTDGGTATSSGGFTYVAPVAPLGTAPTTEPAAPISSSDATLNGMNGSAAATDSSFWVSTSTFSTASPTLPSGVYSTTDLGGQAAFAA